jgi:hypothetical protein
MIRATRSWISQTRLENLPSINVTHRLEFTWYNVEFVIDVRLTGRFRANRLNKSTVAMFIHWLRSSCSHHYNDIIIALLVSASTLIYSINRLSAYGVETEQGRRETWRHTHRKTIGQTNGRTTMTGNEWLLLRFVSFSRRCFEMRRDETEHRSRNQLSCMRSHV